MPNNVTRLLDSRKVPYQAFELSKEKHSALETAHLLGVPPEIVFKTIVVVREKAGKPVLVVVPGPDEVDLKAVAAFIGEKKMRLPTQKDAEHLTGLQAGGISPLALIHKGFQVILDRSALSLEQVHISGGQLGLNIRLPVSALIEITSARVAAISSPASSSGAGKSI